MEHEGVRVVSTIDGDTFDADRGYEGDPINQYEVFRVRIIGYDAPEYGQPGYEAAKAKLARLIDGKRVTIMHENYRDSYGRLLVAEVFYCEDDGSVSGIIDLMKGSL